MKAAILDGIKNRLEIRETELPEVNPNSSLVNVKYCALNHRDLWIYKGQYAGLKFPIILGSDISGVYENAEVLINPSLNWGGSELFQGPLYSILGLPANGGLAEFVSVPHQNIIDKPKHLKMEQAAALPLAGLTAYRALFSRAKVTSTDKIFISGIGGGVALFALQFAVAIGAEVYVSSSDDSKIEKAIQLGAKAGFNYSNETWHKEFLKTHSGVDVVIDGAGGQGFSQLIKICNPGARIALYGATRGTWSDIVVQQVFWKQLNILGSTMGSEQDFKEMVQLVSSHSIQPVVDRIFALHEINEALQYMEAGKQFGKIVIAVNE
ncbi:MAG: zinc-binding dehydrogenase [Saprospiraceae bacterium]|nr:zinc-binding dehydrogenase [Saprospiraceae bacterium]